MNFKLSTFFALLFCLTFSINAQATTIDELRDYYMKALHNCEFAPAVYERFKAVENPSAEILAYRGALEAIMTKTTWNIFKKHSYLKKSEASFNKAVEMEPDNLEIRFMRMAVQYEIPSYLGFSDDMEEDRAFIIKHIEDFNPENFDRQTLKEIYGFMKKCNRFTEEQIERFKGYLALNN